MGIKNGELIIDNGEWGMENGELIIDNGEWGNGELIIDN
jgi:hypothetical protein